MEVTHEQENLANEAVTPNYGHAADEVVLAAKEEFRQEKPPTQITETDQQIQEDIVSAAHAAIDHAMVDTTAPAGADELDGGEEAEEQQVDGADGAVASDAHVAEKEEGQPQPDEEVPVPYQNNVDPPQPQTEAEPMTPYQAQYPPMIEQAYADKKKANLTAEEELVWWRLYMESTNRVDENNHAPRNVWTVQERNLVQSVSDAGLVEMRGRLLTLLSGIEYAQWERANSGDGQRQPSGSASLARHTVASRPITRSRRAGSQASQTTAASGAPHTPRSRRRVLTEKGEIVRDSTYTPRASCGDATPVKGTHVSECQDLVVYSGHNTPHTASRAATPSRPATPVANTYLAAGRQTAIARGGPGGIMRGSAMASVAPSSTSRRQRTVSVAERPPFDLSLHSSVHSQQHAKQRAASRAHTPAPTPRTARLNLQDVPEPLRTVPGAVHTKRQDTVNPTKRQTYKSIYSTQNERA